jgi:lipoprotein-anchoring transpeptidase ErfK/SrfK
VSTNERRVRRLHPHGVGPVRRIFVAAALLALSAGTSACGSNSSPTGTAGSPTGLASGTAEADRPVDGPSSTPGAAGTGHKAALQRVATRLGTTTKKITVGDVSIVARAKTASTRIYPSPGAASPRWTLHNPLPSGAPLVFLVLDRNKDWLHVLVPVRPNESQGWIRAADVTLSQHDYRIVVSTHGHTLTLYRAGKVTLQMPVGLGTGATPTPGGVFYLKELLRPPNPAGAYGPYAYGLSGYSTVLENFGGGNGEIGIHGTNEPAAIGKNVSHGCIRVSNANITKLAHMLPLGVPVQIVG